MTARKRKGIGLLISGVVFAVVGSIFIGLEATPAWVDTALVLIGVLANTLGFVTVFPDTDK